MAKNDEKRLQAGLQLLGYEGADAFLQDKKLDPALAQKPDDLLKSVHENLARDKAAQKRLDDLATRVTSESNPLKPEEQETLRGGLALFGYNVGALDKVDLIKTQTAALAYSQAHDALDMDPESNKALSKHQTRMLKGGLALMGFYNGEINSKFDNETRNALKAYYTERKVPASTKPAADENALASVTEAMRNNPAAKEKMKEIANKPQTTKRETAMLQAGMALGGAVLPIDGLRGDHTKIVTGNYFQLVPVMEEDPAAVAAAAYVEDYSTLGASPTDAPAPTELSAPVVPVGAAIPSESAQRVVRDGASNTVWTTDTSMRTAIATPDTPPSAADIKRAEMENRLKAIEIEQRRIAAQTKGTLDPNQLSRDVDDMRKNIDQLVSDAQNRQNMLRATGSMKDPNYENRRQLTNELKAFRTLEKERASLTADLDNLSKQPAAATAPAAEDGTTTRKFLFWEFKTQANPAARADDRTSTPGARITDVKWVGLGNKDEAKPAVAKSDEAFVGGTSLSKIKDGFNRSVNGREAVPAAVTPVTAMRFETAPAPAGRADDRTTAPGAKLVLVRDDFGKSADNRSPLNVPQGSYAAGFMENLGANNADGRAQAEIKYLAKALNGERERTGGPMTLGSAIVTYKVHAANKDTPDNQLGLNSNDQRKLDRLLTEAGLKKSDKLDPQDPNQMRVLLTAVSAFANDTTMKNVNQKWQDSFAAAAPKPEERLPEGLVRTNSPGEKAPTLGL